MPLDYEQERAELQKAEQDIVAGEMRIEDLRTSGHDTSEAECLLATLQAILAAWIDHRAEILRVLAMPRV